MSSFGVIELDCIAESLIVHVGQLVHERSGKLTKNNWRKEQHNDSEIGPIVDLLKKTQLAQFKTPKDCSSGMRVLLRFRENLRLVDGLLYRKWLYKQEISYFQFVLPATFRKRTVIACHDQFGHLGMDKTLVLLQERFFWPKMNEDVHTHIRRAAL